MDRNMDRKVIKGLKGLLISALLLNAAAVNASSVPVDDVNPYIGFDYYQPFMKGKGAWKDLKPSSYPGFSVYVGTKFHQNFALELGYDGGPNKKKIWSIPAGSALFGTVTPNGVSGTTKVRRSGGHLDVVMFLPVVEALELMGSVGFGWVEPKITTSLNVAPGTSNLSSALASVSGQGRGVFRVGLGLSYMATDIVGFRLKAGWESTSTSRVQGNQAFTNAGFSTKAYKGSTTLALGVYLKF